MNKKKKMIRNLLLFNILIIATFYILLKDQDISQLFNIVSNAKGQYIVIAILALIVYVLCEAINIGRTLKALGEKSIFLRNIKYALIGFFFSSITPAASGGQPMQIYYMYKDKISVANSTLALLINLTSMQIVTISLAIISVIFNPGVLRKGLIGLFILGISLNATALLLLFMAIFSKKGLNKLISWTVKIMKKMKIKNVEEKQEKLENQVKQYQESSTYIKQNKKLILKIIITAYLQFIALYSISYWVYLSFGFSESNIFKVIALQAILYATVSGIPSPGAVGVSEGGFVLIFKKIYPEVMVSSAMLLNRGINFYLLVIISGAVVILNTLKGKKVEKNDEIIYNETEKD
ncbi:MAG: flippase-like domain-containing protein [Clostridia bacterium]|nr:flippase-like domain-containing protein [Clostridia bacterium]